MDYGTDQSQVLRNEDFSSCARLGARTSELHDRSTQLQSCFTEDLWDQDLLVIMTMGGNDLSTITQDIIEGQSQESIWRLAERAVDNLDQGYLAARAALPGRLQLVFSNLYEFTDGTGDAAACPMAEVFDLNVDVDDPFLEEIIIWLESEYFELAKRYDFDMSCKRTSAATASTTTTPTVAATLDPTPSAGSTTPACTPIPLGMPRLRSCFGM